MTINRADWPWRRFWQKVEKTTTCWLWRGGKSADGYGHGRFWLNGRLVGAHQLAWEFVNGATPDGLDVLHSCDVPACVRPDHLFLGDQRVNSRDMVVKGRSRKGIPRKVLTVADRELILSLHASGAKKADIAKQLKCGIRAVIYWVKRGNPHSKPTNWKGRYRRWDAKPNA